jgi:hypothetical protein
MAGIRRVRRSPELAQVRVRAGARRGQCASAGIAIKELLHSTTAVHARIERGRQQIQPVVEAILVRAQQAGVVREDLTITDLPLLQHAIGEVADYTREVSPEA